MHETILQIHACLLFICCKIKLLTTDRWSVVDYQIYTFFLISIVSFSYRNNQYRNIIQQNKLPIKIAFIIKSFFLTAIGRRGGVELSFWNKNVDNFFLCFHINYSYITKEWIYTLSGREMLTYHLLPFTYNL